MEAHNDNPDEQKDQIIQKLLAENEALNKKKNRTKKRKCITKMNLKSPLRTQ